MKAFLLAAGMVLILGTASCGDSDEGTATAGEDAAVMPDVVGEQLDVALSDIKRAGFEDEVEVLGGGTFGVVDESNWQVCEQLPAAGDTITDAPRVTVERSCETDENDDTAAPEPDETSTTTAPTTTEPTPTSTSPPSATASEMEQTFLANLANNFIESIDAMCNDTYTHWSCFYTGVEDGPGDLRVNLATDGGWSEPALTEMANAAGRHWFNFIGCDYPSLNTIVVTINGDDHNVYRSSTMIDTQC